MADKPTLLSQAMTLDTRAFWNEIPPLNSHLLWKHRRILRNGKITLIADQLQSGEAEKQLLDWCV